MTEWYTHFDSSQFGKVPEAQENLLKSEPEKKPSGTDSPASGRPALYLVKTPETEQAARQERA
jgi:hypothetical protein